MIDEQWVTKVLTPLLSPQPEVAEEWLDTTIVVFSADTDRTQAYVFESDKLPEIRGASRILTTLNEGVPQKNTPAEIEKVLAARGVPPECILYASGGSVLALLPDEKLAADIAEQLKAAYVSRTGICTISTVHRPFTLRQILNGLSGGHTESLPESFITRNHFGDIVTIMSMLLRRVKQTKDLAPFIERNPFARTCASCQIRPATAHAHGDPSQPICWVCEDKLREGRERSYWLDSLRDLLAEKGYPTTEDIEPPPDLIAINNGDPIAFIYADGDSIGSTLQDLETPGAYRSFSDWLTDTIRAAVSEAIAATLTPREHTSAETGRETRIHPWEIITIGGDDVLAIIPAEQALAFSLELMRRFRQHAERHQRPIWMSVGFAIGRAKTPVRLLRDAARRVLKSAKRRAHEVQEPCIDFHNFIKEGVLVDDLDEMRRGSMTGRPYTMQELQLLLASIQVAEALPRSQLYQIAAEMRLGEARGSLFYHYQLARMDSEKREMLIQIQNLWDKVPSNSEWPWLTRMRESRIEKFSVISDLVNLL